MEFNFGEDDDDVFYVVWKNGSLSAHKNPADLELSQVSIGETAALNRLCSGPVFATVTVCVKNGNSGGGDKANSGDDCEEKAEWLVSRRRTWRVYGSPYQLTPYGNSTAINVPELVYPHIHYNLFDIKDDLVEIYLSPKTLLCIELYQSDIADVDRVSKCPKNAPFRPVPARGETLFQGSISFEALADAWIQRKSSFGTSPVAVVMNGPQGHCHARILVCSDRRRSIIGKMTHQMPRHLTVRMVHLSILITDHVDRFIHG